MSLLKKAHQHLYFLRKLKGGGAELKHPQLLLQMCGGECTDLLHHSLVLQLHRGREEGTAEGSKVCTKDHRMQLSTSTSADALTELPASCETPSTLHMDCFTPSLRQEAAQHPVENHQNEKRLLPGCCQAAKQLNNATPSIAALF